MITRTQDIEVQPTPEELAREFEAMDSTAQVKFFNELAARIEKWEGSLAMQLQYIAESKELTGGARYVMQQIGAYAGNGVNT